MLKLVVITAFTRFAKGDTITDGLTIQAVLAGPNRRHVVAIFDNTTGPLDGIVLNPAYPSTISKAVSSVTYANGILGGVLANPSGSSSGVIVKVYLDGGLTPIATLTTDPTGAWSTSLTLGVAGHTFSIEADIPEIVSSGSITAAGTGQVQPAIPVLGTPALSAASFTTGAAAGTVIGTLSGLTSGSILGALDPRLAYGTRAGTTVPVLVGLTAAASSAAIPLSVVETLAGATGSPKTTTLTVTCASALLGYTFFASVNFSGLEGGSVFPGVVGTDYSTASVSDLAYVKARAAGPSRLPFRWERMQPTIGGPLDPTYLAVVKAVADAALAQGTTVFIDCHNYLHRTVAGVDRFVDNPDGVLTRAHLSDLWTKLATYFKGHAGIFGYDIQNEPQGPYGAGGGTSADLAAIMQTSVGAIAAVDTSKTIFVEGMNYSSCKAWTGLNTAYPLADPTNQVIYSAHCYPDYDHSGTHFTYAENLNPPNGDPVTPTTLVDMSTPFVNWGKSHNVRVHIGETAVGNDDPRWNTVLLNGLTFWKANNVGVSLWLYGANFGSNPYNLFPYAGSEPLQWGVVEQVLGDVQEAPLLYGPSNGVAGQAIPGFSLQVPGYVAAAQTPMLSDGGKGGTFGAVSPIAAGINPAAVMFTYTPAGQQVVHIAATVGGVASGALAFSSDPANPIDLVAAADRNLATWSSSQAGAPQANYEVASDGTRTATRFSDNSSNTSHDYYSPFLSIAPGIAFEDEIEFRVESIPFVRVSYSGKNGSTLTFDLDLNNTQIGAVLGNATMAAGGLTDIGSGWKRLRVGVLLASNETSMQRHIQMLQAIGVSTYVGNGAGLYVAKEHVYQTPIDALGGVPVGTVAPTFTVAGGTATIASYGTFVNGTTSYVIQWLRDGVAIAGETAATHSIGADGGHNLSLQVIPTNAAGAGRPIVSASQSIVAAGAFVPTSLAEVDRRFTPTDGSTLTQSGGAVTAIADKAGSGKPMSTTAPGITDTGLGLALLSASDFGASRVALGSNSAGGAGYYGRLYGSLADKAAQTQFGVHLTVAPTQANSYGRVISVLGASGGDDYNTRGNFAIVFNDVANAIYVQTADGSTGVVSLGAFGTPHLVEAIFDGAHATLWVDGVANPTQIATTAPLNAAPAFGIWSDNGGGYGFGQHREIDWTHGLVPGSADHLKLQGFLAWDATGDGSLLPTGHPYKTVAP